MAKTVKFILEQAGTNYVGTDDQYCFECDKLIKLDEKAWCWECAVICTNCYNAEIHEKKYCDDGMFQCEACDNEGFEQDALDRNDCGCKLGRVICTLIAKHFIIIMQE